MRRTHPGSEGCLRAPHHTLSYRVVADDGAERTVGHTAGEVLLEVADRHPRRLHMVVDPPEQHLIGGEVYVCVGVGSCVSVCPWVRVCSGACVRARACVCVCVFGPRR